MATNFIERDQIKVLFVDSSASIRALLGDILKGFGFMQSSGVAQVQDAIHTLETEHVDWILMQANPGEGINVLQILRLILREPSLRHIKVSFFADPETEGYIIPAAFALGAFSWHGKTFAKEDLLQSFDELVKLIHSLENDFTLIAAHFLRNFLTSYKPELRTQLELSLLSQYPGDTKILMHLADAYVQAKNPDKAATILNQVRLIDQKMAPVAEHMLKKIEGKTSALSSVKKENILRLKKVVLVDPDTDVLHALRQLFEQTGQNENDIEAFEDGEAAFEWIKAKGEPSLIAMEWRIPKVSGPILVQRVRQRGFVEVPLVICSSLVKRSDIALLREMGVDEVIEKPFDSQSFFSSLVTCLQQNVRPTEQSTLKRKISRLIEAKKMGEAERLLAQMISDPRIDAAVKNEVQAEYFFSAGDIQKAKSLTLAALELAPESIAMLSLLGKISLQNRDFPGALKCFEKANSLAPNNIERLLLISETNIKLGDVKKAKEAVQSALELDPKNERTLANKASLELGERPDSEIATVLSQLETGDRFVSLMNNRAISLVRSGRFEDGIALYKSAVQVMPKKWRDKLASVYYNLGLAHARYGNLSEAKDSLTLSLNTGSKTTDAKALDLQRRVEHALTSQIHLVIKENEETLKPVETPTEPKGAGIELSELADFWKTKLEVGRGDICCHSIFTYSLESDKRVSEMTKNDIRYVPREAIERKMSLPS